MTNNFQQVGQDLTKIFGDNLEFIGTYSGAIESDGTVNVLRPNGTSVNARLVNAGRGSKTFCQNIGGQWYAWREGESRVEAEQTVLSRRVKPQVDEESGLVKVLFYIANSDGTYDFFIGGDRKTPKKIYSSSVLLTTYLSNLGRGLNNWVVGIKQQSSVVNIFGSKQYVCSDSIAIYLTWQGGGLWVTQLLGGVAAGDTTTSSSSSVVGGWVVVVTDSTTSYFSAAPELSGSGSSTSHTESVVLLDGNNYDPGPEPASTDTSSYNYTAENKSFAFYQQLKSYSSSNTHESTYDASSTIGNATSSDVQTSLDTSVIEVPLFDRGIAVNLETSSISSFYQSDEYVNNPRPTVVSHTVSASTTRTTTTPLITGVNAWVYTQTQTTQGSSDIPQGTYTLTLENNVDNQRQAIAAYTYQAQYPSLINSLNPKLGATLKGSFFYFLPPSKTNSTTLALYNKDLWVGKLASNYSQNIYDNPNLTGQPTTMPVWVAQFNASSIDVLNDIQTKVYPLPTNAKVVAASYCK